MLWRLVVTFLLFTVIILLLLKSTYLGQDNNKKTATMMRQIWYWGFLAAVACALASCVKEKLDYRVTEVEEGLPATVTLKQPRMMFLLTVISAPAAAEWAGANGLLF